MDPLMRALLWALLLLAVLACFDQARASTEPTETPGSGDPALESAPDLIPYLGANGRFGFVDHRETLVIPPRFDDVAPFSEDRAAVKVGARWGYIDRDGHWIVRPRFSAASDFKGGEAQATLVRASTKRGFIDINPFHTKGWIKRYRIEANGRVSEWCSDELSCAAGSPAPQPSLPAKAKAETVPADRSGESDFVDWRGFVDGYASVFSPDRRTVGVIDRTNTVVVGFGKYGDLRYPARGFFVGRGREGWGILDASRDMEVVPFTHASFEDVRILAEGSSQLLLAFREDAGSWCVTDAAGKPLRCGMSSVWGAHENLVAIKDDQSLWGALDARGRLVVPCRYDRAITFRRGLARVKQGDLEFYIDARGHEFRDH